MKILKRIFSRFTLFAIILLLEVVAIVFVFNLFAAGNTVVSYILNTLILVVEIVMFLIVVTRKDLPEYKVPWLSVLIFVPVLGVFIYLFFGNHGIPRSQKQVVTEIKIKQKPFHYLSDKVTEDFTANNEKYAGINNYLTNVVNYRGFEGNKVSYYKNGETFFPDFIQKLKEAKEFIFMEFFIIDYGKEWSLIHDVLVEKVKEGVEVRVLYDDIGCSGTLVNWYYKTLRKEGIQAYKFNKFRPFLSGGFNYRSHRKICVIDHKYGFTGGMNLADEYANDIVEFGYWKDSMICIEGPAIINLLNLFFTNWDLSQLKTSDYAKYFSYKYEPKGDTFVFPFGDGPAPIYKDLVGEETFINLFNSARKSLLISSPYLIPTYNLITSLKNAAQRGVDVHIIVPDIPDKKIPYLMAKSHFRELSDAGVKVHIFEKGFNHQKSILVDDEIAFIGTINLDYRSLVHHYECGAIVYKGDVMKEIAADMHEMMDTNPIVPRDFKLKPLTRLFCSFISIFAVLL